MARVVLVGVLMSVVFLGGIANAQEANAPKARWIVGKPTTNLPEIQRDILALQREETQAIKDKNARALCKLLADGWAGTTQMGVTLRKAQYCDEMTDGDWTYPSVHRENVRFYVFGNDLVEEWWRDTSTMVYKGRTSYGPRKCSVVYAKVDGRWLDVAHMTSLYTAEH